MSSPNPDAVPVTSDRVDNGEEVRLWNPDTAGVWSFFLSPIFGAYIARENWKALGNAEEADRSRKWIIASIVAFIVAWITNMFLDNLGNLILIVFLVTWYFVSLKRQVKYIKNNGVSYIRKPWLKVLSLGLLSIYGSIFAIMFAFASTFAIGDNYGTLVELNGDQLYYTASCSEAEARSLGQYLVKEGFFVGRGTSVQLNQVSDTYEFRMVVKKGFENDQEFLQIARQMASELSTNVFNGSQVEVHLCDDRLETLRVVVDF